MNVLSRSTILFAPVEKPRIYADFNKGKKDRGECWIFLTQQETFHDFNRLRMEPKVGLEAIFYMKDADDQGNAVEIEVEGIMRYTIDHGWVAVIDEATIRHIPASE